MNRNQKIALGCGGAGCLGLIVVAVAGVLMYAFIGRSSSSNANRSYNFNVNSNRTARDSNTNADDNENAKAATDSPGNGTSSFSNEEKHRLFQAAGMVGDTAVVTKVLKRIGLMSEDGTPSSDYASFMKDHFAWALRNSEFIQSVNTKEKAQAYLDEHLDD